MATTTTSGLFKLNWKDFLKSLAVAALTAPFTTLVTSLQAGNFHIDWKALALTALTGALGYLTKNFLTPAQTVVTNETK